MFTFLKKIYLTLLQKKWIFLSLLFMLTSCTVLPGIQNLDISRFPQQKMPYQVNVSPIVIPINAAYFMYYPQPAYIYRLAPQDILSITIWQHPEFDQSMQRLAGVGLSNTSQYSGQLNYSVDAAGNIYFPLIGYIHASGKTVDEVRRELTYKLRRFIKHPQVIIQVAEYRGKRVYVLGEINKPSLLPMNDQRMTIMDALALSGSIDLNTGDPQYIYVIRGSVIRPEIYWLDAKTPDNLLLAQKFVLQSGDIIYVSTAIVTRWNRFLSQLLPTMQTIFYTKAVTGK